MCAEGDGDRGQTKSKLHPDDIGQIALSIMRRSVPRHASLDPQLAEITSALVLDFVACVSGAAAAQTASAGRREISGDDVVVGLEQMGMEEISRLTKIYVKRLRKSKQLSGKGSRMKPASVEKVVES